MKAHYLITVALALFVVSCDENANNKKHESNLKEQHTIQQDSEIYNDGNENQEIQLTPEDLTKELLSAARDGDINKFLALIPESGVIISIDNFIDTTSGDYVITPDFDVKHPLFWGVAPSGDSIIMTFEEMFKTYLAKDFLAGIESDQPKCLSTVEFNAYQLWQDITLYEYCLNPPAKKNDILNWQAIRFIFSVDSLMAIVLDRWSP